MKIIYFSIFFMTFLASCDDCENERIENISLNGEEHEIFASAAIKNVYQGNKIIPDTCIEEIYFSFYYPKNSTKEYRFRVYFNHEEVKKGEYQIKYGKLSDPPLEPWGYGSIFDVDIVYFEYSMKNEGNTFKITSLNKRSMTVDFNLTWYKGPDFNGLEEVVLVGKDIELKRHDCTE